MVWSKFLLKILATVLLLLSFYLLPYQSVASAQNASTSVNITSGWNLLGNGTNLPISVSAFFSNTSYVTSVWKWNSASSTWAFYSPSLTDGGVSYAATQGYEPLTAINPGEGYWINAADSFLFEGMPSAKFAASNFVSSSPTSLLSGWNLISIGDGVSVSTFYSGLNTSLTSLWAWDATNKAWYFYAPSLASSSQLSTYITNNSYEDFVSNNVTLQNGVGFWVNNPTTGIISIRGILSGLADGSSVVLTNQATGSNTTNQQTLANNGAFSWSLRNSTSGTYSITVSTQPSGQICTVSNGAGSIATGITNLLVSCANSSTSGGTSQNTGSGSTTTTNSTTLAPPTFSVGVSGF